MCQLSTLAECARSTVEFLHQETPVFVSPELRPPNSRDPNLVDWATRFDHCFIGLHVGVHAQQAKHNLARLNQELVEIWADYKQTIVEKTRPVDEANAGLCQDYRTLP